MSIESPHEIFVRTTNEDGKKTLTRHRVWDSGLFMAARKAEVDKEIGKGKKKCAVAQITEDQYKEGRK